jgi:hypothetical protein
MSKAIQSRNVFHFKKYLHSYMVEKYEKVCADRNVVPQHSVGCFHLDNMHLEDVSELYFPFKA